MIAVLDYGIGNLRSAFKALQRVAANVELVSDPGRIEGADGIVIPGVGEYGSCVKAFKRAGFESPVRRAVASGTPVLGICVGMQMLYEGSDESPDISGLGHFQGIVRRLPESVRLPQMQWNRITVDPSDPLFAGVDNGSWVYFVHSFAADAEGPVSAVAQYGASFAASVRRGRLFGVQFHPEKSSTLGLAILSNFATICGMART